MIAALFDFDGTLYTWRCGDADGETDEHDHLVIVHVECLQAAYRNGGA